MSFHCRTMTVVNGTLGRRIRITRLYACLGYVKNTIFLTEYDDDSLPTP